MASRIGALRCKVCAVKSKEGGRKVLEMCKPEKRRKKSRPFPGGPVVYSLSFQCKGHQFRLW